MDMKKWINEILASDKKKPMPVLSFPSVQLLKIGVDELIRSSELLSEGMKLIAEHTDAGASFSMMDLSVEAEAFGSNVQFSNDEVPTVIGSIVNSKNDAEKLAVPGTDKGRIALYIEAIKLAKTNITDRPVFAGVIGPLSLAGRLIGVSEIMISFYEEPEMVHLVLEKATDFIIKYSQAFKEAGADGVAMAEPVAGLLSPALCEEFSTPYVKRFVDELQSNEYSVVYHNCGNSVIDIMDSILKCGAMMYHFGNAVPMEKVMQLVPKDVMAMGNIDPAGQFKNGTPESMREAVFELMDRCSGYDNFVISSGCDIPPSSSWDNIDAFFKAVEDYYAIK